jgi:hypothetical protein
MIGYLSARITHPTAIVSVSQFCLLSSLARSVNTSSRRREEVSIMSRTRGRVILIVHVPLFSLEPEGLVWPSDAFIATAPTLNSNVTQQSLALGMLGVPQSHDCRIAG